MKGRVGAVLEFLRRGSLDEFGLPDCSRFHQEAWFRPRAPWVVAPHPRVGAAAWRLPGVPTKGVL